MWVHISDAEFQQRKALQYAKRKNVMPPFIAALAFSVAVFVCVVLGIGGRVIRMSPLSSFDLIVLAALMIPIFLGCFCYLLRNQRRYGSLFSPSSGSHVCSDCQTWMNSFRGERCQCGGRPEPSENFRWEGDIAEMMNTAK